MQHFKNYIKKIKEIPLEQITEHSHRSTLQILLSEISKKNTEKIKILHEPKREGKFGSPDFKISNESGIIGYIENKKIDDDLNKTIKSKQIKKYRNLSDNILLTNYLDFIWLKDDTIQKESLCNIFDLQNKKYQLDTDNILKVQKLIESFFSQAPQGISTAKELAIALAIRGENLKDFLQDELKNQQKENTNGLLLGLYETFKAYIFTDLSISDFADVFAQMLVYGLFQAKLNADTEIVTLLNAKKFIPKSFKLIQELVGFLDELSKPEYKNAKWIIDEVISLMNNLDLPELKKSMSFSKSVKDKDDIDTDPYIYFYETFLAAYDKKLRKAKGVYYTPPQVVNLIVNSINNVLQNTFKIKAGFSDRKSVTVLDFATGTGTFLIEIIKLILNNIPNNSQAKKELIISEHILKNIYGFEYLIAPYAIAHLKLAQFLKENNYNIKDNERLQIFLTNTLEPTDPQVRIPLLPALTQEAQDAQKIKDKPILVITGNPPYSGHSKNAGEWISQLLKGNNIYAKAKTDKQANYFEIDGKQIKERNSKWLQDDYVKFIRFAQHKIDQAGQGVVGIITNHSFLNNPTFRGMRQSLMQSFDIMYFIDLHGNSKKKEIAPNGKPDKNVFDIQQGVAISILVKKPDTEKQIYYSDFWGTRKEKFEQCLNNDLQTIEWKKIEPSKPFYIFKPQNKELKDKYLKFWNIKNIFKISGVGITSSHDNFVMANNKTELLKRFENFKTSKNETDYLHKKFNVKKKKGWEILKGWNNLQKENDLSKFIETIAYRPFDSKYIFYEDKLVWRTVRKIMKHFDNKENIAINVPRQIFGSVKYNHVFVTNEISDINLLQTANGQAIFPLYLYSYNTAVFSNKEKAKKIIAELEKDFLEASREYKKLLENEDKNRKELDELAQEEYDTLIEEKEAIVKTTRQKHEIARKQAPKDDFEKVENFTKEFRNFIDTKYNNTYSPEEIVGYIYAILHSEIFRNTYAEFLKIDYPHIPFIDNKEKFEKLSKIGWKFMQIHLQNEIPENKKYNDLGSYIGSGNNLVLKPEYKTNTDNKRLYINKTQYFDKVSEEIYNFHIGGYQVLNKYLKDRKNKILELDDIENIENIIKIISYTTEQKNVIDKLLTKVFAFILY